MSFISRQTYDQLRSSKYYNIHQHVSPTTKQNPASAYTRKIFLTTTTQRLPYYSSPRDGQQNTVDLKTSPSQSDSSLTAHLAHQSYDSALQMLISDRPVGKPRKDLDRGPHGLARWESLTALYFLSSLCLVLILISFFFRQCLTSVSLCSSTVLMLLSLRFFVRSNARVYTALLSWNHLGRCASPQSHASLTFDAAISIELSVTNSAGWTE